MKKEEFEKKFNGSLTIIPKDPAGMKKFLEEVAKLVESGLKEIYKSKEDLPKELDKGLSKYEIKNPPKKQNEKEAKYEKRK